MSFEDFVEIPTPTKELREWHTERSRVLSKLADNAFRSLEMLVAASAFRILEIKMNWPISLSGLAGGLLACYVQGKAVSALMPVVDRMTLSDVAKGRVSASIMYISLMLMIALSFAVFHLVNDIAEKMH